jgi:signal transduction histidine kinase
MASENSGSIVLRPKARLFAVIGRELIRDESVALSELVKNSYDADATFFRVSLKDVSKPDIAWLEIRDDGHGMSRETVLKAWVEPATSFKRERGTLSPKGRILLGEKGVGRFAVDKLGSKCELITRREGEENETVLYLDSQAYDKDVYLDEVKNHWQVRPPTEIMNPAHGTIIRISKLRTNYSRESAENLHKALSRLVSPVVSTELPFDIQFRSPDYPELEGKIHIPLPLERAPYTMKGSVDKNGEFTYVIKNEPLHEIDLTRLDKETKKWFHGRTLDCGPFKMYVYAWEKSAAELKRAGVDEFGNQYLKENFGVKIYRDGFRVLPYGDVDDDWLDLEARRVQNPTLRLGRNRVFGWIEISRKQNPKLVDKTNREGLIQEGKAYEDLRRLCVNALSLLENYRFSIRPSAIKHEKQSPIHLGLIELKQELKNHPAAKLLATVEKQHDEEIKSWEEQVERMADLAGIGVSVERITHEFEKTTKVAKENQEKLLKHLSDQEIDKDYCRKIIGATLEAIEVAETQLRLLSPLYFPQRGKMEDLSIEELAKQSVFMLSDSIVRCNADVKIEAGEDIRLQANRGKMLQVFLNLIDNAIYWLEVSDTKKPKILVSIGNSKRIVTVADNGPGVSPKDVQNIFQPFFSTKPKGRGLGLYICRDILGELDADIEYLDKEKLLPGANFRITFKKGG